MNFKTYPGTKLVYLTLFGYSVRETHRVRARRSRRNGEVEISKSATLKFKGAIIPESFFCANDDWESGKLMVPMDACERIIKRRQEEG